MKGEAACAGGWRDESVMIAGRMPGNHSINKNVQGHEYELKGKVAKDYVSGHVWP